MQLNDGSISNAFKPEDDTVEGAGKTNVIASVAATVRELLNQHA